LYLLQEGERAGVLSKRHLPLQSYEESLKVLR
jgi:hypothetical protein